jgi:hypothetical protein
MKLIDFIEIIYKKIIQDMPDSLLNRKTDDEKFQELLLSQTSEILKSV